MSFFEQLILEAYFFLNQVLKYQTRNLDKWWGSYKNEITNFKFIRDCSNEKGQTKIKFALEKLTNFE